MKISSIRFALGAILVGAVVCPVRVSAQWVYVNDNNPASGANTATGFSVIAGPALALVPSSPFTTNGTGIGTFPAPVQEVAASVSGSNCLFVSDPLVSSGFPTGDVAAFVIGSGGGLTLVGRFFDPSNTNSYNHVIPLAIDRRPVFPYLFAAFTGENKIVFFKIAPNCQLVWVSSTLAIGLNGGSVVGMAVSRTGPHVVVVTYGDGSIQSFKIVGGSMQPRPIFFSTGYSSGGGQPEGVDITRNGKFAVYGDHQTAGTEVEVSQILLNGNLTPTVNYNLAGGLDSRNVWLSPGFVGGIASNFYLYVTNNASGQVSTFRINQMTGAVTAANLCTLGYTNPTTLAPSSWANPAGLHSITMTGSGGQLVVAEYGAPSSVALLKIQASTGCTQEATGSPFADPFSNNGLESLDVFPSRPY